MTAYSRRTWFPLLTDLSCVCAVAVIWLCIGLSIFGSGLHAGILNDQVNYITAARNLSVSGELTSSIIYPSTLLQRYQRNYLYMPGHALVLSWSYTLFGYGVFQSFLPNLLSFVLTMICTFLSARKLYDRTTAYLSTALFLVFPLNLLYAVSAMAEMTLIAATILALCVFLYLPDRAKPYLGACLPVLPFLFRETGALVIVPMAFLVFSRSQQYKLPRTLAFLLLACPGMALVYKLELASGRPSLFLANYFDARYTTIYTDAVANASLSATWNNTLMRLPHRIAENLTNFAAFIQIDSVRLFSCCYAVFFVLGLVGLCRGLLRRDAFAISTSVMVLTIFSSVVAFYYLGMTGIRIFLFTLPLSCIACAAFCRDLLSPLAARFAPYLVGVLVFVMLAYTGFAGIASLSKVYSPLFQTCEPPLLEFTNRLEQLEHDDQTLLVCPCHLLMEYSLRHHPVKCAFLPANSATLDLLNGKYRIGTILWDSGDPLTSLTLEDFVQRGFFPQAKIGYQGSDYWILRPGRWPSLSQ